MVTKTPDRGFLVNGNPLAGVTCCCCDPMKPGDCDPPPTQLLPCGFPLNTEAFLDKVARGKKRNATEFRPGPYRPGTEGTHGYPGGYDIIPVAAARMRYANERGIAVLHSLIDFWDTSFFGGLATPAGLPTQAVLDWIRAYVQATKGSGSIYHLGNEMAVKAPELTDAWKRAVYDAAKAAGASFVGVPINPFRQSAFQGFVGDFVTIQNAFLTMRCADLPAGLPAITTETEGGWHTEDHYVAEEAAACPRAHLFRWFGQVNEAVKDHILGVGPVPPPICADKTAIRSIGMSLYSNRVGGTPKDQFGQPYGGECSGVLALDAAASSFARLRAMSTAACLPWVQRGRCEMEKGFRYRWTLNGTACASYPAEGFPCWLAGGNPLELSQPAGGQVGACPQVTDGNNCGWIEVP